jgi:hypothetical protein
MTIQTFSGNGQRMLRFGESALGIARSHLFTDMVIAAVNEI